MTVTAAVDRKLAMPGLHHLALSVRAGPTPLPRARTLSAWPLLSASTAGTRS